MSLFEFVQWCFRDGNAGFWTVIVGWLFFTGLASVIAAFRSGK